MYIYICCEDARTVSGRVQAGGGEGPGTVTAECCIEDA